MAANTGVGTASVGRVWRVALIGAVVLELLGGLSSLPVLFGDLSEVPGPGVGGWIITAKIALQPLVALTALVLVATGRLREALAAMAAVILMNWLSLVPSVSGFKDLWSGSAFVTLFSVFQIVLAPLLAVMVAVLAARNLRLTLATALAVLPTAAGILGIVAFAIGVAMYGF